MLLAQVTPADVIGEALRLHLGPTAWPAVASRSFSVGPFEVMLEVLAASHRVRVCRQVTGSTLDVLTETVACGTAATPPVANDRLPSHHRADLRGATYQFSSATEFGDAAVGAATTAVRTIDCGLQVGFPGHPDALTGISLHVAASSIGDEPTALSWTTWHVYPGARPHVVTTSSNLALHGGPQ